MGIRTATVRRLGVPDLITTVPTQTLTALAADSTLAGGANVRWGRRLSSVVSMLIGCAGGAWLAGAAGLALPLVITGACVLIAAAIYSAYPSSKIVA